MLSFILISSLSLLPSLLPINVPHLPLFLPLALERPGRWFADFHRDICVQRIPLDLNQSVGQRADAILLHRVLCVLYFIKSAGQKAQKGRERWERGVKRHREVKRHGVTMGKNVIKNHTLQ